jgi:cytochrome b
MSLQEVIEVNDDVQPEVGFDARPALTRIRLWDLPTRLFHWSLVLAVSVAVITGELGGRWMDIHAKAGLTIVGLVTFRVVWGFIGSTHARFLSFLPTPSNILAYLKGRWQGVGHNPLGAFSVFALLGLLAVQASTGLFTNDDIAFTGPLNGLVDEALAGRLTGLHRQLANVLLALLALHIVAIFFYVRFKKDNLVKPMVTGWKEVPVGKSKSASKGGPLAFVVALAIALVAVAGASGAFKSATKPAPATAAPASPAPSW